MLELFKISIIAATVHAVLAVALVRQIDCVTHMTYDGAAVCVQWEVH